MAWTNFGSLRSRTWKVKIELNVFLDTYPISNIYVFPSGKITEKPRMEEAGVLGNVYKPPVWFLSDWAGDQTSAVWDRDPPGNPEATFN